PGRGRPATVAGGSSTSRTADPRDAGRERDKGGNGRGSDESCGDACAGEDAPGGGVESATFSNRPPAASQNGAFDLTLPLILLAMAGAALVVGRTVKRGLAPAGAADEPEPDEVPRERPPRWDDPPPGL
ncbi:hypothetical protein OJ962_21950, partial [Solirubrobacter sp. CPCC 204708]